MIKASEVESAIRIVLNGGSNVREANDFIIRFVELAESWEASLGLFQSPDEHIRYFVSNIIYTKVKKHWVSQLNAAQQEEIYRFLISVVENPGRRRGLAAPCCPRMSVSKMKPLHHACCCWGSR